MSCFCIWILFRVRGEPDMTVLLRPFYMLFLYGRFDIAGFM